MTAKLLGVTFCHYLKFDKYVKIFSQYVISEFTCLKGQGLSSKELHTVFCALVSRICSASLWRYLDCRHNRLCRVVQWGYNGNLKCCQNFFMMRMSNCLEAYYIAPTVSTSYFPFVVYFHEALRLSLCFYSPLLPL